MSEGVTKGYRGLKKLKVGVKGLQKVTRNRKYYKHDQWVTRGYMGVIRGSMVVTSSYKG